MKNLIEKFLIIIIKRMGSQKKINFKKIQIIINNKIF